MKKILLGMVLLILSGVTVACNQVDEEAPNPETPTSQTLPPPPNPNPVATASTPFSSDSTPTTGKVNLIPPTTSKQRRAEILKGRPDPYATFPAKAEVVKPENPASQSSGNAEKFPSDGNAPRSFRPPIPGEGSTSPVARSNGRGQLSPPSAPVIPPPPPSPDEAEAVNVSGVIQLGGTSVAILTAPGEKGVRHVKPGDRIAEGQVLVKSINISARQPFVVLEQYGQEVIKVVGDNTTAAL